MSANKKKTEPLFLSNIIQSLKKIRHKYGSSLNNIIDDVSISLPIDAKMPNCQVRAYVREALSYGLNKDVFQFSSGRYFLNENSKKTKCILRKLKKNKTEKSKTELSRRTMKKVHIEDNMEAFQDIGDYLKIKSRIESEGEQNNCIVPVDSFAKHMPGNLVYKFKTPNDSPNRTHIEGFVLLQR